MRERLTNLIENATARWVGLFLFFTLIGLMNFNRFYTNELAEGGSPSFSHYFINEMTGAYAVLLLLPFMLLFFKRFPLQRKKLLTQLPIYLLASVAFGASHTLLMFGSRKLLYWLILAKDYDYGQMGYRLLMEYNHQFFTFWTVYAVYFLFNVLRENQRQRLHAVALEQQLAKARLQALRMQLNPHFLFNTLNLISSTMYENVEAADKMLASLSDLLRLTLSRGDRKEHALTQELELLQVYFEIMKARFADKLTVRVEIAEDTAGALVPAFILQPLVENSIIHGMESLKIVEITMTARRKNGRLVLTVRDNGPGISQPAAELVQHGVGLANTAERLDTLYGQDHGFSMQSLEQGGLEVTMEIPLRTANGKA